MAAAANGGAGENPHPSLPAAAPASAPAAAFAPALPQWPGAMVVPPPPPPPPPPPASPHFAQRHFVQFSPMRHYPPASPSPAPPGGDENKTLWVGDLHYWMDEYYLHGCFAYTPEIVAIKIIRNKLTGQPEGYGFVEFCSHAAAEKMLQALTGHIMPNTDQPFRLNWASFSMGDRRTEVVSDHSIFVGDLASDVTDAILLETFSSKYPSVKGAKVVADAATGRSKGYGFVRFGDDNEKARAMTEMNGVYCSSRAMRLAPATPRKSPGNGGLVHSDGGFTNTTVFVGGLDPSASEDDLRQTFSPYGEIASVKIPVGKHCGFVQFVQRKNAEDALQGLNGTTIGKQTVRLSWGRNPANRQMRVDFKNWNGMYYAPQFYSGYGYPAPYPDHAMYVAAAPYGAYPFYGNPEQVS